jgi:hypothetical protein
VALKTAESDAYRLRTENEKLKAELKKRQENDQLIITEVGLKMKA